MASADDHPSSAWVVEDEDLEHHDDTGDDDFAPDATGGGGEEDLEDDEALDHFVNAAGGDEAVEGSVEEMKADDSVMTDDTDPEEKIKTYYNSHSSAEKVWYTCKVCNNYTSNVKNTFMFHVKSAHGMTAEDYR